MAKKEVQGHLDLSKDKLLTLYDKDAKPMVEVARLRLQNENKAPEPVGLEPVVIESERPVKRARVVCVVENSLNATSTALYAALLAEFGRRKCSLDTLVHENHDMTVLARAVEKLRAMFADTMTSCTSAKYTHAIESRKNSLPS